MSLRDSNEMAFEILKRLVEHESKNSLFDEFSADGADGIDVWSSSALNEIIEDSKKLVYGKEYPERQ